MKVRRNTAQSADMASAVPSPDQWVAGKRRLILMAIVAVSVLVRLVYYVEATNSPLGAQHHWEQSDMRYFDGWARAIAAGDWLSRDVDPPLHTWHFQVASDYFRGHPEELARLRPSTAIVAEFFQTHPEASVLLDQVAQRPDTESYFAQHPEQLKSLREQIVATRSLWEEWGGPKRFYQEPLYPYLLALTYKIAGPDARYVFLWQLMLGVSSNVLIYLIARRSFGDTAGAIAGLLATLCAPLLYFEMVLLRETLVVFAGLLLVWLAGAATQRSSVGWWFATGAALGLSLTLKSHFLIFLLGVLAILAVQYRKNLKDLLRFEAAAIVGILIALTPQAARNVAVGVSPLAAPGNGSITFVHGNANEPGSSALAIRLRDAGNIMGRTGGRLLPTIVATLETYDSAGSYVAVLWEKFQAAWHWLEPPDNTNFYFYRLHAASLRWLPVTFLILAPFSLAGLLLGVRPIRRWVTGETECHGNAASHLYLLVLTNLAVLILFFVRDRYRAPLTAALIPFAALALAIVFEQLRSRRPLRAAVLIASVALLACWTATPLRTAFPLVRLADYLAAYQVYYGPMEERALKVGDNLQAAGVLTDSLRFEPEIVKQFDAIHRPNNPMAADLGNFFAAIHLKCADDYCLAGQVRNADRERARAEELSASCSPR